MKIPNRKIFLIIHILACSLVLCSCAIFNSNISIDQVTKNESESRFEAETFLEILSDYESETETDLEIQSVYEIETELETETEIILPPIEPKDDELVYIKDYIPDIIEDIKYATTDNFCKTILYDNDTHAKLRYGTLKKLKAVQEELKSDGFVIKIWDGFRPHSVQIKMYNYFQEPYVANPYTTKSNHNKGNTVDLTICTLDGEEVIMPSAFDTFNKTANRDYSDVSKEAANHSKYLENIMVKHGFIPYYAEWWHYTDQTNYPFVG